MSTTQPIRNPELLQNFKNFYQFQSPNPRNYTLCIMGLNTALRITDILNLKWKDIYDFEQKSFRPHLCVTEKKTGKRNIIAINHAVVDAMETLLKELKKMPEKEDFIFSSRKGNNLPISRCQAYRIIKNAAYQTGMKQHISCHSLRKTFGYYAWQQGIPPALIMTIYNHSSYQITKRYLGIEQDDKDKVFMNITL